MTPALPPGCGGAHLPHSHCFLTKSSWRTGRARAAAAAGGQAAVWVPPGRSFCFASVPKAAAAMFSEKQSVTLTHQEMPALLSVRKYVWHSNQIRFIKKLAIKFLRIHNLNFDSCNILLVHNNTVSHIYIIIFYITKIAVLYYWITLQILALTFWYFPQLSHCPCSLAFTVYNKARWKKKVCAPWFQANPFKVVALWLPHFSRDKVHWKGRCTHYKVSAKS